jgi:hypothetical protein
MVNLALAAEIERADPPLPVNQTDPRSSMSTT